MFNSACAQTIIYGLRTDTISAVEYLSFEPKIAFTIYGSEDAQLPMYCTMDNAGPDGAIIIGCCNFTEAKICEACTVLLGNGLFLKNRMILAKKNKN